jgi:hypothetical protein
LSRPIRSALRDFALIVIGVLVALYFEGWNAERVEDLRELDYLRALIVDVQTDTARFRGDIERAVTEEARGTHILAMVEDQRSLQMPPDTFFKALDGMGRFVPAPYARGTYDDLVMTGDIHLIEDGRLRQELAGYYGRVAELDRFAELYRQRLWDGYLSHVVATVPIHIQAALLRGEPTQASDGDVRQVLNALRARPDFPFNLKNAVRSYILIQNQQAGGLDRALEVLDALETAVARRSN